mgnify:CR=1 FL=1
MLMGLLVGPAHLVKVAQAAVAALLMRRRLELAVRALYPAVAVAVEVHR